MHFFLILKKARLPRMQQPRFRDIPIIKSRCSLVNRKTSLILQIHKSSKISSLSHARPVRKQFLFITAGTDIGNRQMFRQNSRIPQHDLIAFP
jgi:hypothetical protein